MGGGHNTVVVGGLEGGRVQPAVLVAPERYHRAFRYVQGNAGRSSSFLLASGGGPEEQPGGRTLLCAWQYRQAPPQDVKVSFTEAQKS